MSEDERVRTTDDLETGRDPVSPGKGPEVPIRPEKHLAADQEASETLPFEDDARPWRQDIALTYRRKAVLAVPVDIQTSKLPRWRPRSVGDIGRASQDDE